MKNKTLTQKRTEKGQIIVLLAVSLVVVMMVAALAVDGGMIYTERRFAQNASDAASLAGGGAVLNLDIYADSFSCPPNINYNSGNNLAMKAYNAAKDSASLNNINNMPLLGYYINYKDGDSPINGELKNDPNFNSNHGVMVKCYTTPTKKVDVEVRVTSQLSTAFAHLFYPGDLVTTNVAVTTMHPGNLGDPGMAIITTAKNCDGNNNVKCGIYFSSNAATLKVTKSGIFSSNCLIIDNSKTQTQFDIEGKINLVCDKSEFLSDSQWPKSEDSGVQWLFNKLVFENDPETATRITPKNPKLVCDTLSGNSKITTQNSNDKKTFGPGKYSEIDVKNGEVTLTRGLYCITGDIKITGGTVVGNEVTFYQYPGTKFEINGGNIELTASNNSDDPDPLKKSDPYYALLFYLEGAPVNNGDPLLNGNASTVMNGMFYAPNRWVSVSGAQDMGTTYGMQFVVKHFEITGKGTVNIVYNPKTTLPVPPQIYLQK